VSALLPIIVSRIRERGPITIAEFMELALYHPEHGYYAAEAQRSGRGGDFFTSVDVGPLFGEMIAAQLDEMWRLLRDAGAERFDVVEAGAGNGRLSRDILNAAAAHHQDLHRHLRLTLVERSDAARAAAARLHSEATEATEQDTRKQENRRVSVASVASELPPTSSVIGVILANELLDALPVHSVTMTPAGLREIFVNERDGRLYECDGPPSDDAIAESLARLPVDLPAGARAEVGLEAERWIACAANSLERGFLLLFDYGHDAEQLLSPTHAGGTLMAYRSHTAHAEEFLRDPGTRDLTAHLNLTAIRQAAERAGLTPLGGVDQTYFLTGLGIVEKLGDGRSRSAVARRLAAKSLLMPGGLGSTMKVVGFGCGVGRPALRGLSLGRLT
jgi:SAM-dependent MidA family methyltransferase